MHDHIVHKRALRVEQRRILRLSDGEPGTIVHRDMLNAGQRLRPLQPDVTHMRDVEYAHAGANRVVLGDNPARRRVFDRHIPAVEFDHLRAHLAMDGVERGLANGRRGRLNSGQWSLDQSSGCWDGETHYPNMWTASPSTRVTNGTFLFPAGRATVRPWPPPQTGSTAACNAR